jgi:cytochrome c oxidase subunit IV
MATTPLTSDGGHGDHHITHPNEYRKVLLALTVLMLITIGVAQVAVPDVGPIPGVWLNNLIAIGIAALKALLVIFVFMGVKHASSLTRIWVAAGFVVLGIMYGILADHLTRQFEVTPGWNEKEGSALPRIIDPLNERVPSYVETNVRPRQ